MNEHGRFSCSEMEGPDRPFDRVGPLAPASQWAALRDILSPVPAAASMPLSRIRSTEHRCENLKMLILELTSHDMRADDVALMLKASASSARSYIIELCDAGVIAASYLLDGTPKIRRPYYRLLSDVERVHVFAVGLMQPGGEVRPIMRRGRPRKETKAKPGTGRNSFPAPDDIAQSGSANWATVQRDPLVAALFGSARQQSA